MKEKECIKQRAANKKRDEKEWKKIRNQAEVCF